MPVTGLIEQTIELPSGLQARLEGDRLVVTGNGRTLQRTFAHPRVRVTVHGSEIRVRSELPRRKDAALLGTYVAHVRNMVVGLTEGFTYEMKIVYSHFPVKVGVKGSEFVIENFLGEKFPRRARIRGDTKVDVQGDLVVLTGPNLEDVSQTAASIEQATRIRGFDPRVFQDGIYITKKAGEA